jgi:agmatine/peptidylarginine deiminase
MKGHINCIKKYFVLFCHVCKNGLGKIKKDVPAYHIDNNTFNEEKPKTYEEMTDDELDRQYEELKRQREERRKRRKEKDFEM